MGRGDNFGGEEGSPVENTNTTQQQGQQAVAVNTLNAVDNEARARLDYVEKMFANLEQMGQLFNTQILTRIQQLQEQKPATELTVAGFTIKIQSTPKQDVFISGVNRVGRPGAVMLLNDGTRDYSIGKIDWDHIREVYTLSVGRGVN
jgi:hypothetical protein